MDNVLLFPGVEPCAVRPAPTSFDELADGEHALVIVADPKGFAVEVRPGEPDFIRRATFAGRRQALQFARRSMAGSPGHFRLLIDETPEGARSLDRILGPGPDPMGVGAAQ